MCSLGPPYADVAVSSCYDYGWGPWSASRAPYSAGVFTLASIRPWSPKPLISSVVTVRTRTSFRKPIIFSSPLAIGVPRGREWIKQTRPRQVRYVPGDDERCLALCFFQFPRFADLPIPLPHRALI